VCAQSMTSAQETNFSVTSVKLSLVPNAAVARYADQQAGVTVDQAVADALEHNGELLAARQEIDAASALVRQAALRANPKLDASLAKTVTGADNNITVNGMLPLELGGRRPARIRVAERELEMRRQDVANRERMLAADVRAKFGEALAAIFKLGFDQANAATTWSPRESLREAPLH
jgi:cobalt-zinc-cadmium efflux system outer membrane protein